MITRLATALWVDDEYDREHASDGVSRFGHYVRSAGQLMADCWDDAWDSPRARQALFAVAAWETAIPPVMSPGLVRRHPRVLSAHVERSQWDGSLLGVAELVTPWPAALRKSDEWRQGQRWWDWRFETFGGTGWYSEPGDEESAGHRYLLPAARMQFPLAAEQLPAAPDGPDDNVEVQARAAVEILVSLMNEVITPVITLLEQS
jgi:hypothetical protein